MDAVTAGSTLSLSFVVVGFSDELKTNFLDSPVTRTRYPLHLVDNQLGIAYPRLSAAMIDGCRAVRTQLVCLVHEDVWLPENWDLRLADSIRSLEVNDPDWGVLGSVGWTTSGRVVGHWSDPRRYKNTLAFRPYAEVTSVDEQMMILHTADALDWLDVDQPGIHFIARRLAERAALENRKTYVVDAPTVHKRSDARAQPITSVTDSEKIAYRNSHTYRADVSLCEAYLDGRSRQPPSPGSAGSPVLVVGAGGSGTRLAGELVSRRLFIGSELNPSWDSMEVAEAIYRLVLARHLYESPPLVRWAQSSLFAAAAELADVPDRTTGWGFKMPETLCVLDDVLDVWADARVVWWQRDPLPVVLRRTHMTGRLNNHVGRAVVRAAYAAQGLPWRSALTDDAIVRSAHSVAFQLVKGLDSLARMDPARVLTISFEQMQESPHQVGHRLDSWLGAEVTRDLPNVVIDPKRSRPLAVPDTAVAAVKEILADVRRRLGYL